MISSKRLIQSVHEDALDFTASQTFSGFGELHYVELIRFTAVFADPTMPTTQRHRVTFGNKRVTAYYRLELGKEMKGMEAPVQAVVEKHLRQFRDQAERMK